MSLDRFFMAIVVFRTPENWQNGSKIIREIYMTMMQHLLVQLYGDRTLESSAATWGENWHKYQGRIGELWNVRPWSGPGPSVTTIAYAQPDRDVNAYEMSLAEIRGLLPPRPDPDAKHEFEWEAQQAESYAKDHAMLDRLDPDGRYAVLWVECY